MIIDSEDFTTVGSLETSGSVFSTEKLQEILEDLTVKKISVDPETGTHGIADIINPLSVVVVDGETFENHILDSGSKMKDALYLVQSENLNGYGKRIVNVATPKEDTDAANKAYVDFLSTYTLALESNLDGVQYKIYEPMLIDNDQMMKIMSADMVLSTFFETNEDSFNVSEITMMSHTTTGNAMGLKMKIETEDGTEIATSEPLDNNILARRAFTFKFQNPATMNLTQMYKLSFSDTTTGVASRVAAPSSNNVTQPTGNLKCYYTRDGATQSANVALYIKSIKVAGQKTLPTSGIIMTDAADASKQYFVQLSAGEFVIKALN